MAALVRDIADTIASSRIYATAAYAILIWDWILMLPTERKYIWPGEWSLMKVLYLANRYLALIFMAGVTALFNLDLTVPNCDKVVDFEPYSLAIILCLTSSIMLLRVHALFGQKLATAILFGTVIVGEIIVLFYLGSFGQAAPLHDLGIKCCVWSNVGGKDWFWLFFAYPLIIDVFVFCATAFKVVSVWRMSGRTHILTILLRDGLVFFLAVLVVNLLNTISFIKNTPANNPAFHSPFSECWTSMMCSHIVLSLKKNASSQPITANNPFSRNGHTTIGNSSNETKLRLGNPTHSSTAPIAAPSFQLRHLPNNHHGGEKNGGSGHSDDLEKADPLSYNYAESENGGYASGIHVSVEKRVTNEA